MPWKGHTKTPESCCPTGPAYVSPRTADITFFGAFSLFLRFDAITGAVERRRVVDGCSLASQNGVDEAETKFVQIAISPNRPNSARTLEPSLN
jgi:hypothetical protein